MYSRENKLYLALLDWVGSNAWIVQAFAVVFLVLLFNALAAVKQESADATLPV